MVKFADVVESTSNERLDYGTHLVKIEDIKNQTKDGDELLDENGVEMWNITFFNNEGKHYEYFRFSGKMANKTGYLLRAIGLLKEDEKISECEEDFDKDDAIGKYLYIEIVENKNAQSDKYRKQIKFDGFKKYEGKVKEKPKKKEVDLSEEIPF